MKTRMLGFAIALMPTLTLADTSLEDWQKTGLEKVREYKRVIDAEWQKKTLLWMYARPADVSWDTVADQMICNQLRSAGKPEGLQVMVAFYDANAASRMEAVRMGYAICK